MRGDDVADVDLLAHAGRPGEAHGGQQLALWNARHDERGFASMHIYHVAGGTPAAATSPPPYDDQHRISPLPRSGFVQSKFLA